MSIDAIVYESRPFLQQVKYLTGEAVVPAVLVGSASSATIVTTFSIANTFGLKPQYSTANLLALAGVTSAYFFAEFVRQYYQKIFYQEKQPGAHIISFSQKKDKVT